MNARQKKFLLSHIIELLLLTLIVAMWIAKPSFMTLNNWLNIFRSIALKGVIAYGMTMVIISGMIDLSIGSTVAMAGVVVAYASKYLPGATGISIDLACSIGIVASFLVAVLIGIAHGFAQERFGMPAFIVTLASQLLLYGLAGIVCGGFPIANAFPGWFTWLGMGRIGGVPVPAIILLICFGIAFFIVNYTNMGRSIYAVGGNTEAARLSGINVMRTKIFCFVATALMATLGGFLNSAQVLSASFSFGKGWETDVISAVVIGGTSMAGGIGTIWGTMLGIVFIGVMTNSMTLLDVSVYMQYVIRAALLFLAVLLSIYLPKLRKNLK